MACKRLLFILNIFYIHFLINLSGCQTKEKGNQPEQMSKMSGVEVIVDQVQSHLSAGKVDEALEISRRAVKTFPDSGVLFNLQGICYLATSQPAKAAASFRSAYSREKNPAYVLNLGTTLIEMRKFEKAISLLKKLQNAKTPYVYPERISHNLGLAYERLGDSKNAKEHFSQALHINSSHYSSAVQFGKLELKDRNYQKASELFKSAAATCPICLEPVEYLTEIYLQQGQSIKAVEILKSYQLQPHVSKAHKLRAENLSSQIEKSPHVSRRLSLGR